MIPEDPTSRRRVYLVTFSSILSKTDVQAEGQPSLRDPSSMTREQVRDALVDAVAHPMAAHERSGGRPRSRNIYIEKMGVACEQHNAREDFHFHVALKLSGESRFLALKQALRMRSGLASHWSTSHNLAPRGAQETASSIKTRTKKTDDEVKLSTSMPKTMSEPFLSISMEADTAGGKNVEPLGCLKLINLSSRSNC